MTRTTDDLMKNRACDYDPCVALAVPGQLFCSAHATMVARGEGDSRRGRRGQSRPVQAHEDDQHVDAWLPLNRESVT